MFDLVNFAESTSSQGLLHLSDKCQQSHREPFGSLAVMVIWWKKTFLKVLFNLEDDLTWAYEAKLVNIHTIPIHIIQNIFGILAQEIL